MPGARGNVVLRLVGTDGKGIDDARFVRGIPGQWAVREFPHVFTLEGKSLFTTGPKVEADIPGSVSVFCDAPTAEGDEDSVGYRGECSATVPPGTYEIAPFGLAFEVGDTVVAKHPALSGDGRTLSVRCAPSRSAPRPPARRRR